MQFLHKDTFDAYNNCRNNMSHHLKCLHFDGNSASFFLDDKSEEKTRYSTSATRYAVLYTQKLNQILAFFELENWACKNGYILNLISDQSGHYEHEQKLFSRKFEFIAYEPEWNEFGSLTHDKLTNNKMAFCGGFINHGTHSDPDWHIHT